MFMAQRDCGRENSQSAKMARGKMHASISADLKRIVSSMQAGNVALARQTLNAMDNKSTLRVDRNRDDRQWRCSEFKKSRPRIKDDPESEGTRKRPKQTRVENPKKQMIVLKRSATKYTNIRRGSQLPHRPVPPCQHLGRQRPRQRLRLLQRHRLRVAARQV
jgi:hypothetical protein